MSITVPVHLGYEFEVKAKAAEVFAVLADVPKSASHFPKVHQLSDLGDGAYQWDMEKVGTEHINIHTVYASRYVSNKAKGRVEWTPVEGIGNALVSGSWKIKDNKKSTHVELDIRAEVHVPLPHLMHALVEPMIHHEFTHLVETYIHNLIQTFGGEV